MNIKRHDDFISVIRFQCAMCSRRHFWHLHPTSSDFSLLTLCKLHIHFDVKYILLIVQIIWLSAHRSIATRSLISNLVLDFLFSTKFT